jgi:hypothetical protein
MRPRLALQASEHYTTGNRTSQGYFSPKVSTNRIASAVLTRHKTAPGVCFRNSGVGGVEPHGNYCHSQRAFFPLRNAGRLLERSAVPLPHVPPVRSSAHTAARGPGNVGPEGVEPSPRS